MKKILLILLLFPLALFGQKISNLPVGAEPDADDIFPMNIDGTTSKVTKSLMTKSVSDSLSNVNDSVTVHRTDLAAILARVDVLEDSVYVIQPPDATLILDYKLNGDTRDTTTYNNHGTASSGFIYWDRTDNGTADMGSFWPLRSYVTTPTINLTSTFSIGFDMAMNATDTATNQAWSNPGDFYFNVNPMDSTLSLVTFSSSTDSSVLITPAGSFSTDTISPYTMVRVVATVNRSGGSGAIYVNGVDMLATGSVKTDFDINDTIYVGTDSANVFYLDCGLDNFRVWSGLLSATDVSNEYILNEYYNSSNDVDPPVLQAGVIESTAANRIDLTFNEKIVFVADTIAARFTFEKNYNDAAVAIDSVKYLDDVSAQGLRFYTATVAAEDTVRVNYAQAVSGGVDDIFGNQLAALLDSSVTNNLCNNVQLAQFGFNGDATDNLGGYDGTDSGTNPYGSTTPPEGSDYLNSTSSPDWAMTGAVPLGSAYSFALHVRKNTNNSGINSFMSNIESGGTDGFEYLQNEVTNRLIFRVTNSGGTTDSAYADYTIPDNGWFHSVVTVDDVLGKVKFYVDGSDVTTDSMFSTSITYSSTGPIAFSGYTNHVAAANASIDDAQFYGAVLDQTGVDSVYTNRAAGTMYSGCGAPGDPPEPIETPFTTYADSIWATTFNPSIFALDAEYHEDDAERDFVDGGGILSYQPFTAGMGDQGDEMNVSIVDVDAPSDGSGSATRTMRINHKAGRAGIVSVCPDEGGGNAIRFNIATGYYELYLSFNFMRNKGARQSGNKMPHLSANGKASSQRWEGAWMLRKSTNPIIDYYRTFEAWYMSTDIYTNATGPNWGYEFDFSDSTWYNVTLRYYMNTTGNPDGFVEAFVNGVLQNQWTGQRWISTRRSIDEFYLRYFHGGACPIDGFSVYQSPVDEWLLIDDIYIFKYKDGYGPAEGVLSGSGRVLTNLPHFNTTTNVKIE